MTAPATSLDDVLTAISRRVSYLRAEPTRPTDDAWIDCEVLATDAGARALAAAIDAGTAGRGGGDRQVGASLFAQSYAFKTSAIALAAYAIGLPAPSPSAGALAVRLAKGRAAGLALRTHDTTAPGDPGTPARLAEALLAQHLAPFLGAVRREVRIGERLLWGNVAASCAAAFRAVEGAARDRGDDIERAHVRARAATFFAAAEPWLGSAGRFELVEHAGSEGWFWTRTSCCLWFRTSGGPTCDDCSLIAADDLLTQRHAELKRAS
ncbi:MAG: IucA/IucC family C-terminal-domain containing protein [Acidimicrobiales bacterium]